MAEGRWLVKKTESVDAGFSGGRNEVNFVREPTIGKTNPKDSMHESPRTGKPVIVGVRGREDTHVFPPFFPEASPAREGLVRQANLQSTRIHFLHDLTGWKGEGVNLFSGLVGSPRKTDAVLPLGVDLASL